MATGIGRYKMHLLFTSSALYQPTINKALALGQPMIVADKLKNTLIHYRTYDNKSTEIIRMTKKPDAVLVNESKILETNHPELEGWNWKPFEIGGLLTVRHLSGNRIAVMGN